MRPDARADRFALLAPRALHVANRLVVVAKVVKIDIGVEMTQLPGSGKCPQSSSAGFGSLSKIPVLTSVGRTARPSAVHLPCVEHQAEIHRNGCSTFESGPGGDKARGTQRDELTAGTDQ